MSNLLRFIMNYLYKKYLLLIQQKIFSALQSVVVYHFSIADEILRLEILFYIHPQTLRTTSFLLLGQSTSLSH